jgi:hypothetical protein
MYNRRILTKTWSLMTLPRPLSVAATLLLILAPVLAARAQNAVYAGATLTNYGVSYASRSIVFNGNSGGFTLGGFHNFPIKSRVTVGIDLRLEDSPSSTKGGFYSAAALRVAFVPHHVRLRPYFQLGGGVVSTNTYTTSPFATTSSIGPRRYTNGALELVAGLDLRITNSLDWRVLDYGAAAGANSSGASGVGFVTTGIVYHFSSSSTP